MAKLPGKEYLLVVLHDIQLSVSLLVKELPLNISRILETIWSSPALTAGLLSPTVLRFGHPAHN